MAKLISSIALVCLAGIWSVSAFWGFGGSKKQVLVFGGNGFIGSAMVHTLLVDERFDPEAMQVTVVNRGNHYWDSADRVFSRVSAIQCDRKNVTSCEGLASFVAGIDKIDVVVDFSADDVQDLTNALTVLGKDRVDLYVLISTDAVYDVSEKTHEGPMREEDAKLPTESATSSYGERKLRVEEELRAQTGLNYVIFRLPTVLGPRDTSHRWWVYQLLAKLSLENPETPIPVTIPTFLQNNAMSFVFVDDVAQLVADVILDHAVKVKATNNVFNIAMEQTVTGEKLLRDIARELQIKNFEVVVSEDLDPAPFKVYTSIERHPVSVEKATSVLGWRPSPWREVLAATVTFYEMAMTREEFASQREEIMRLVTSQHYAHDTDKRHFGLIEKLYAIDLTDFRKRHSEL